MSITKDGLFKYQALNERQRKNLLILEAIRKKGKISKASLSKQLGYNIVTLSNYIEEYIRKNLVRQDGYHESSGGRKPVLIELNKEEILLIGIDFNRDNLKGVLSDAMLNVVAEAAMTRPAIEQEDVKGALVSLIKDLIRNSKADQARIKCIAVGVYGGISEKNGAIKGLDEDKGRARATVYYSELKQAIESEFNIKTFFGQDASFAAFGEKAKNIGADVENMLYIFKDIGKGVMIKGEIYCGTDLESVDIEGIIGSMNNEEKIKLREESSYLRPWSSQVVERGVGTRIVELLKGDLESLNDEVIIKAASEKDEVAIELIEGVGINLGVRIAYLINLFSPQIVIVGGGIEKAGDILFRQISKTIEKLALEKPRSMVKILPATLGEKAVSLGAATVALREVFLEA
jgi:N-acetylglucosamine repressor